MDPVKKALIVYASAGHGHEKAARSIQEACQAAGIEGELIDTVKLAPGFFGEVYRQTYLLQIQYVPWLWGIFYYAFDHAWLYYGLMRFLRRILNALTSRRFEDVLRQKRPDIIIATHFLAVEVSGNERRYKRIDAKIMSVVTDYMPHCVWMDEFVDAYVVAADFTKEELVKRGVAPEKVHPLGIPVQKKFLENKDRAEVAAKLGLRSDVFTALLTSGGGGIGAMADVTKHILALDRSVQLLVVCGTNKHLYEQLKPFAAHNPLLKVYEFVNNMDELMVASDIIVGKGGGLTVTEALSKKKPMILFGSVPGQEARNAECLTAWGACARASSVKDVAEKILYYASHRHDLDEMTRKAAALSKPESARHICELAKRMLA